jgi:hypothetical protein
MKTRKKILDKGTEARRAARQTETPAEAQETIARNRSGINSVGIVGLPSAAFN